MKVATILSVPFCPTPFCLVTCIYASCFTHTERPWSLVPLNVFLSVMRTSLKILYLIKYLMPYTVITHTSNTKKVSRNRVVFTISPMRLLTAFPLFIYQQIYQTRIFTTTPVRKGSVNSGHCIAAQVMFASDTNLQIIDNDFPYAQMCCDVITDAY